MYLSSSTCMRQPHHASHFTRCRALRIPPQSYRPLECTREAPTALRLTAAAAPDGSTLGLPTRNSHCWHTVHTAQPAHRCAYNQLTDVHTPVHTAASAHGYAYTSAYSTISSQMCTHQCTISSQVGTHQCTISSQVGTHQCTISSQVGTHQCIQHHQLTGRHTPAHLRECISLGPGVSTPYTPKAPPSPC